MASMDIYSIISSSKGLSTQAITTNTTTNGDWLDTQEYYAVLWQILSGTITDGTYTPNIQEADLSDYSDAANVSTDFIIGTYAGATFTSSDDNVAKQIGYAGKKRYVRIQYVSTGVSSGGTLSAIGSLGYPRHASVA